MQGGPEMSITKKQLEELEEAQSCGSRKEFRELLSDRVQGGVI